MSISRRIGLTALPDQVPEPRAIGKLLSSLPQEEAWAAADRGRDWASAVILAWSWLSTGTVQENKRLDCLTQWHAVRFALWAFCSFFHARQSMSLIERLVLEGG